METREYFEKVMQDYNQNRKGRSLGKYCKDEAVDYDWLIEFKKSYRSNKLQSNENKKLGEGELIALTVEENFVPEQKNPAGWQIERLILKSPSSIPRITARLKYYIMISMVLSYTGSGLMMISFSSLFSWRQLAVIR